MKSYQIFLILILTFSFLACGSSEKEKMPIDTLQTYTQAIKKKDVEKMKLLLSAGSIKMAEEQAKAQNISLDEVILRETLFSPDQKELKFRNEKVEGDYATIEVETFADTFDRIPFVKENGIWKIAKEKYQEEMIKKAEEDERKLEEKLKKERDAIEESANKASSTNTNSTPEPTNTNVNNVNVNTNTNVNSDLE